VWMVWGAAASLPLALAAALWSTRLQHEQDFVGVYGANVVVNLGLIIAIFVIANYLAQMPTFIRFDPKIVMAMAAAMLLVMAARLVWMARRLRASSPAENAGSADVAMPRVSVWLWAALAAGLPLTLPFVARSMASAQGEGTLALFGYSWKMVELPQILLLQLVAMLALPSISRAFAEMHEKAWGESARQAVSLAFALAWALGCACLIGLLLARESLARLLFGWGAMNEANLVFIWAVSAWGALALPALGVTAIASAVLAARERLAWSALAHAAALAVLLASNRWMPMASNELGQGLMAALTAVSWGVALVLALACGAMRARAWPWLSMAASLGAMVACGICAIALGWATAPPPMWAALLGGTLAGAITLAAGIGAHAALRDTVRKTLIGRLKKA
jgi:putative peptidoglycan lipid II flippase